MITVKGTRGKLVFHWSGNDAYLGYAYMEDDGFYVFVFAESTGGSWSGYVLKAIADKLSELNKPWQDLIDAYFEDEERIDKQGNEGEVIPYKPDLDIEHFNSHNK